MPSRRIVAVSALFIALTALMTWPQCLVLATDASEHPDVFFNLWRMRWIHHALSTAPFELFDGNQFYPERGVLAFSDAMLIEGLIGAPLLALGLPPVLVHNLLLLGAVAASGVGMFVLARHLSGSTAGGVAAGIIFAFAPYRVTHYMHMELQWALWMPWTFWALQRTLETGALKFGALTGAFFALQLMSSIYYAAFLAVLLPLVGLLQSMAVPTPQRLRVLRALALGAVVALPAAAWYGGPYMDASRRVGLRSDVEVRMFSARPRNYVSATDGNLLYGARRRAPDERRLFPGVLAPLMAIAGLLLVPPRASSIAYLIGLVAAFELSLGLNGWLYSFLYQYVSLFQGLRAPARAAIFVLLFLGVLAAHGWAALQSMGHSRRRRAFAAALVSVLLLEYWVAPLRLAPYHNSPPPLYEWLARQPRGVVAEFPMNLHEPRYLYMSTFHWMPRVNGYSGYIPPSFVHRMGLLDAFPDVASLARLHADGVKYLIVHAEGYSPEEWKAIVHSLNADHGLGHVGDFDDGWGAAAVFRMR